MRQYESLIKGIWKSRAFKEGMNYQVSLGKIRSVIGVSDAGIV
jgi:hypothetical protein